jgi:Tfp pilus assembly protein PilF
MLRLLNLWLGEVRARILIVTLVITGLASLALNLLAGEESWSLTAQTLLVLAFVGIALWLIGVSLSPANGMRFGLTVLPSFGLVILAVIAGSRWFPLLLGLATGWLIAAQFLIKDRTAPEYKRAIKHLRKREYKEAALAIEPLLKREADNPEHYRFRAEMYRLGGKFDKAVKDYEKMTQIAPQLADGYNGLAEVYLQQGDYPLARTWAEQALEHAKGDWVAAYNLGMIEDRLGESQAAIAHLRQALAQGLPDSRHRLLTWLWLARAHYRQGEIAEAETALEQLRQERKGFQEWEVILADEQAATLREVIADDVKLARTALEYHYSVDMLFGDNP